MKKNTKIRLSNFPRVYNSHLLLLLQIVGVHMRSILKVSRVKIAVKIDLRDTREDADRDGTTTWPARMAA